jgi:hypothetical protein
MSNHFDDILAIDIASVPEGHNYTLSCPNCGKPKLSVMNRGTYGVYHCWSSACGVSGVVPLRGHSLAAPAESDKPKLNPYKGTLEVISTEYAEELHKQFGLDYGGIHREIRGGWNGRLMLPIWSPKQSIRGYVGRVPWGVARYIGPKSIIYREKDEPMLSWYRTQATDISECGLEYRMKAKKAVLVEDQISAMRVAQDTYYDAVALLGTELDQQKIAEIQSVSKHVILALDSDATSKAFRHARKWSAAFESFRVAVMTKDPKDCTKEELREKFC